MTITETGTACHGGHAPNEDLLERGRHFLRRHLTVDVHAHPGRFFMRGADASIPLSGRYPRPDPERVVEDMRVGGVSAAVFATVADHVILGMGTEGLHGTRPYRTGEVWADCQRQLDLIDDLLGSQPIALATGRDDIVAAHERGETGAMIAIEGGDFVEDRLDRLAIVHNRGVRTITLVHYATNQLGDPQTTAPVHGGVTALGRAVIRMMNHVGILVDLTHASFETARDAVAVGQAPMLLSHSNIARDGQDHPRLITLDHARLVTDGGGVVGAVPAGFGQSAFDDYVQTILWMIDQLGIDHVAIGTDMDFTYRPVLTNYAAWPQLAGALLESGLLEDELAKVMGGNFLRLLDGATA